MAVNYTVPGTKYVFSQPNTMACWATVYAMMISWRRGIAFSNIRAAVTPLGQPWLGYFDSNTGVPSNQGTNFERAAGLVREARMNPSPKGWEAKLKTHGLLWVSGVVPGGIHDRILEGIVGDETGPGTSMHIIDPDRGRRYTEPLSVFIQGFEGQAAVEPFYEDYQILHF